MLDQERDPGYFMERIQEDVRIYYYYYPELWEIYVKKKFDERSHQNEISFQQWQLTRQSVRPPNVQRPMRVIRRPSPVESISQQEQPMQQTPPDSYISATNQRSTASRSYRGPTQLMQSKHAYKPITTRQRIWVPPS